MSAKKTKEPAAPPSKKQARSLLEYMTGPGRWIVGLAMVLSLSAALWRWAWDHVREHVLTGKNYRLEATDIEVTAPPSWVHADVKAEALKNAGLDHVMSIMQEDLTVQMAQAFRAHPWVASVQRVSKQHPAKMRVELSYREPVAMVEVAGGLLPVDIEGTLLPSEGFTPAEVRRYARLGDVRTQPRGTAGSLWQDPRVVGGARLAAVLSGNWQRLGLYRIGRPDVEAGAAIRDDFTFELSTSAGRKVLWGRAPGDGSGKEAPPEEKLARLIAYVAKHGSLDKPAGTALASTLDLRVANPVEPEPAERGERHHHAESEKEAPSEKAKAIGSLPANDDQARKQNSPPAIEKTRMASKPAKRD